MKKTTIILSIILLNSFSIFAQQKELFIFDNLAIKEIAYAIAQGENNKLYVAGKYSIDSDKTGGIVYIMNMHGEVEKTKTFPEYSIYSFTDIRINPITKNLYVSGNCLSEEGETIILQLNYDLEVIRSIFIPLSVSNINICVGKIYFDNKNIIQYGNIYKNTKKHNNKTFDLYAEDNYLSHNNQPFFVKLDSCLNTIIAKNILDLDDNIPACSQIIASKKTGHINAFITRFPVPHMQGYPTRKVLTLLELDENMQISDTISIIERWALFEHAAAYFQNKIVVATYLPFYLEYIHNIEIRSVLIKHIDTTDFSCSDSTYLGSTSADTSARLAPFQGICINNNCCYVAGTNNLYMNHHGGQESEIMLRCIDENLETAWDKFYSFDNTYFVSYYITPLSNGNLAICGLAHDLDNTNYDTDFMVLIVDKEGHLTSENSPFVEKSTLCFPSPATSKINIRIAIQHKNCTIEIYNINGKLLKTEKANSATTAINISDFPSGNYIYKVYNIEGFVESGKFVKGV